MDMEEFIRLNNLKRIYKTLIEHEINIYKLYSKLEDIELKSLKESKPLESYQEYFDTLFDLSKKINEDEQIYQSIGIDNIRNLMSNLEEIDVVEIDKNINPQILISINSRIQAMVSSITYNLPKEKIIQNIIDKEWVISYIKVLKDGITESKSFEDMNMLVKIKYDAFFLNPQIENELFKIEGLNNEITAFDLELQLKDIDIDKDSYDKSKHTYMMETVEKRLKYFSKISDKNFDEISKTDEFKIYLMNMEALLNIASLDTLKIYKNHLSEHSDIKSNSLLINKIDSIINSKSTITK